jgi:HTH-type transcriptional regulator/antitoxin HigA
MNALDSFSPDWVSPPGETISDILEKRKIHLDVFAEEIGCSASNAAAIIKGRVEITIDLAQQLATALGPSASFWMTRESQYRTDLARLSPDSAKTVAANQGIHLSRGLVRRAATPPPMAAFRTSPSFESQPAAVAVWLREGEQKSTALNCMPWKPEVFRSELPSLRSMTRIKDPRIFLPDLRERCRACGVAVVVARTPSGCRASGATRFLSPQKAMILLSFRYLSDDQFWFTFFHEAGHLLLHNIHSLFLEGVAAVSEEDEREANTFSERILIPDSYQTSFSSLILGARSIVAFAKELGISPGIVVGQLQHFGRIKRSHFNGLKVRFDWDQVGL